MVGSKGLPAVRPSDTGNLRYSSHPHTHARIHARSRARARAHTHTPAGARVRTRTHAITSARAHTQTHTHTQSLHPATRYPQGRPPRKLSSSPCERCVASRLHTLRCFRRSGLCSLTRHASNSLSSIRSMTCLAHKPAHPSCTQGPRCRRGFQLRVCSIGGGRAYRYTKVCRDSVRAVVDGFNSAICAYGQTSSGKTFTILGGGVSPK